MVQAQSKGVLITKPQSLKNLRASSQHFCLDNLAAGADDIQIALVELAVAPLGRPIGAVDGLNLVALKETGQFAAVFGHHTRQRHGEIIAHTGIANAVFCRAIGQGRGQLVTPFQDAKDQLVAFFAIFT